MERVTSPASPPVPTMPAVDAVLAAAALLLPVREIAGQPNHGAMVRAILASVGLAEGNPWCMAFVSYAGHGVLGARWPLPRTGSCDVALEAARAHGLTVTAPARGDLFLIMKSRTDATHVGFVTGVDADGRFRTLEGNTNAGGGREGDGVYQRVRGGAVDRAAYLFVRWPSALLPVPSAPALKLAA